MAAIIRQNARLLSRSFLSYSVRTGSSEAKKPENTFKRVEEEVQTSTEGFYTELKGEGREGIKGMTPQELARELGGVTGMQRQEIIDGFRGIADPFDLAVYKQGNKNDGSKEFPILVPTTQGKRVIGCVCEEDISEVSYMLLMAGTKKQCNCGNWFQAIHIPGSVDH